MIVGITGTLGSGKGSVVEYLVKRKGFAHYSSSGLLKDMLEKRGGHIDRDAMAQIAREIRAKDPAGVPKLTYKRLKKDAPENAILESLHTLGEVEFVRGIGGSILGVDAPLEVRYRRILGRGSEKDNVSYEKFLEQTKREEDALSDASGHNIRGAIAIADHVIINDGTLEELYAKVDLFLEKAREV